MTRCTIFLLHMHNGQGSDAGADAVEAPLARDVGAATSLPPSQLRVG